MKRFLPFIALLFIFGCAASPPQAPTYSSAEGQECAAACLEKHSKCMASEVRPDYLFMSPRKKACDKMLRECYQLCAEKD